MSITIDNSPIGFYIPFTLDDEIEKFKDNNQNYIMNFKLTSSVTDAVLDDYCALTYEGIPLVKIPDPVSTDSFTTSFGNKVFRKVLPRLSSGDVENHVLMPAGWQAIYTDLVIGNELVVPEGTTSYVNTIFINSNYVVATGSDTKFTITKKSVLLTKLIADWKSENKTTINPSNKDMFGSTADILADILYQDSNNNFLTTTGKVNFQTNIVTSDISITTDYPIYVTFYSSDPGIAKAVIGINVDTPMDYYTVVQNNPKFALSVGPKTLTGPLTGISSPTYIVSAKIDGNTYHAIVDSTGKWTIPYPTSPLSQEKVDAITVTEAAPENYSSTYLQIQTDRGLPIIKPKSASSPGTMYSSSYVNQIQSQDKYTYSSAPIYKEYTFKYLEQQFELQSLYLGRDPSSTGNTSYRYFLCYPDGVVNQTGIELLYFNALQTKPVSGNRSGCTLDPTKVPYYNEYLVNNVFTPNKSGVVEFYTRLANDGVILEKGKVISPGSLLYAQLCQVDTTPEETFIRKLTDFKSSAFAISAGPLPYQGTFIQTNISYTVERPTVHTDIYKTKWSKGPETTTVRYSTTWEKNVLPFPVSTRYSMTWEREVSQSNTVHYFIRYDSIMPGDQEHRQFYEVTWEKTMIKSNSVVMRTSWESEKFKEHSTNYKLRWDTALIDRVLIKPYYIQQIVDGKLKHCISYQVYADYKYLEHYVVNGDLLFYFSNPSKYELVRFDYNMLPYKDIFMTEINDELIDIRDTIPSNYSLLGNYTIQDIDINSSCSLDIMVDTEQVNEYRSYWIPEDLEEYKNSFITLSDGVTKALPLSNQFRDDHHIDIVELDLVILSPSTCCFTQKSVGSRCSPY